jgi:hypothetical protein
MNEPIPPADAEPIVPPALARSKRAREALSSDYSVYLKECNDKVMATRDFSLAALPEHVWRAQQKEPKA